MTLDELAKMMGFTGEEELHKMVAAVDMSTPVQIRRFQVWKEFDGSKGGLEKLLPQPKTKPAAEEPTGPSSMEEAFHAYRQHYVNPKSEPLSCPGCEYEKRMKS